MRGGGQLLAVTHGPPALRAITSVVGGMLCRSSGMWKGIIKARDVQTHIQ